jgi:hypothetical protein
MSRLLLSQAPVFFRQCISNATKTVPARLSALQELRAVLVCGLPFGSLDLDPAAPCARPVRGILAFRHDALETATARGIDFLNDARDEGWELVSVPRNNDNYFKRRRATKAEPISGCRGRNLRPGLLSSGDDSARHAEVEYFQLREAPSTKLENTLRPRNRAK